MTTRKMKNHDLEKQYKREWYYRNRQHVLSRNAARKQGIKKWFHDFKTTLSCSDCGFSHPAALDFHHLDPSDKEDRLSVLVAEGCSKETIMAEVTKCKVLCSNCHRILHYKAPPEGVEPSSAGLEVLPLVPLVGA